MEDQTPTAADIDRLKERIESLVQENKRLLDAAIGSYRLFWQVLHRSTIGGGTKGQIILFNREVLVPTLGQDFADLLDQELARS